MTDEDDLDRSIQEKAPDAFRTISEVAQELDLPQHVLRFWETRFPQIKPLKRGGGRRYYRPNDVELLRGIRHLLYGEGYTIRGVQRILREQGLRFVAAVARGEVDPGQEEDEEAPSPRVQLEPAEAPDWEPEDTDESDDDGAEAMAQRIARSGGGARRVEPVLGRTVARREPEPDDAREDKPAPPVAAVAVTPPPTPPQPARLAPDEVKLLEGMLSDLLECKRLLDQAR